MPGGSKPATAHAYQHMVLDVWLKRAILELVGVVSVSVVARRVVIRACTSEGSTLVQPLLPSVGGLTVLRMQRALFVERYAWLGIGLVLVLDVQQRMGRVGQPVNRACLPGTAATPPNSDPTSWQLSPAASDCDSRTRSANGSV